MQRLWIGGIATVTMLLGGCGAVDDSPLVQEQLVNLSPSDSYAILDGGIRMASEVKAPEGMSVQHSSDGYHQITVTYRKDGRDVMVQTLRMDPGNAANQTKIVQNFAPAPSADEHDRRAFARIKGDLAKQFDRFGAMMNSETMKGMIATRSAGPVGLSGGTVMRGPAAPVSGTAPVMDTSPVMDTAPGLSPS